jgi:acyl CoA:acetate/3-ketoacid CoA transferase beta subunit
MINSLVPNLIKGWDRNTMASKIAKDLPHGAYVNLGIGMPELVSQYVKNYLSF